MYSYLHPVIQVGTHLQKYEWTVYYLRLLKFALKTTYVSETYVYISYYISFASIPFC